MNVFFLSREPFECARFHHDKHVVKMVLETTQILCTVNHRHGNTSVPYQPTHESHPSVLWAGDNVEHYYWLVKLGLALSGEYTYRFNRVHACEKIIRGVCLAPRKLKKNGRWQDPPLCMPDEFKIGDAVTSYRAYYLGRKVEQSKWTRRPVPQFVKEFEMAKKPKVEAAPIVDEVPATDVPADAAPAPAASRGPKGVAEDAVITLKVEGNPKRPGSKAYERFAAYRNEMTVKEALDAGVLTADLVYDAQHGFIEIAGWDVKVIEKKVREPKAPKEPKAKKAKADKGEPVEVADEVAAAEETFE